jgi:hypothetical protein
MVMRSTAGLLVFPFRQDSRHLPLPDFGIRASGMVSIHPILFSGSHRWAAKALPGRCGRKMPIEVDFKRSA